MTKQMTEHYNDGQRNPNKNKLFLLNPLNILNFYDYFYIIKLINRHAKHKCYMLYTCSILGCVPACQFGGEFGEQVVGIGPTAGLSWGRWWPVVCSSASFSHLAMEGAATCGATWKAELICCGSIADAVSRGTRISLVRSQRCTVTTTQGVFIH